MTRTLTRPFKEDRRALLFHSYASLLQAIEDVMLYFVCPQAVSQAPQHFRSSEKQATCEGCFARQSVCSVVYLHSGMSRAVHPQEILKVDVDHRHIQSGLPIRLLTFCSKLVGSVRMMARVVPLSPLGAIQRRTWVTASTSIVQLEFEAVYAVLSSWMVVAPCLTVKPHPDWSLVTEQIMTMLWKKGA